MSKVTIKDHGKFYSRILLLVGLIVISSLLITTVIKMFNKDPEVSGPETGQPVAATPEADPSEEAAPEEEEEEVAFEAPVPIKLYQGPFIDLGHLPEGTIKVLPKGYNYPRSGVKGLFISSQAIEKPELMAEVIKILDETEINALVIDFKDDNGYIRMDNESDHPLIQEMTEPTYYKETIDELRSHGAYLIARMVTFRDPALGWNHPEYGFSYSWGGLLASDDGHVFVNPLMESVWEYNTAAAELAIDLGFDEVQFDYVRFAEGIELIEHDLVYDKGNFSHIEDLYDRNRQAISGFLDYARQRIHAKDALVSADIFGYVTFNPSNTIGQDPYDIVQRVDALSAMIYPSHWGPGYFDLPAPDKNPYTVVAEYMKKELEVMSSTANPPISRPWLQAFTAEYLGEGNYMKYGPNELAEQVKALADTGVTEYLLWQASGNYKPFYPELFSQPPQTDND